MLRCGILLAVGVVLLCAGTAPAQTSGVLYTWNGTGNIHDWVGGDVDNVANVTNSTPGQLTVVELGDPVDPFDPGLAHAIHDGFNRRFESSTEQGGLDVWGLEALEIDLSHNASGPINVQFYVQATPAFNYVWAGSNGALNGPDWNLAPNVQHTLRFPLNLLTPAQQAYIRGIGVSVREHTSLGNVTWNIFELRSTGVSPAVRNLATHDIGTSDNGLNGAFINFEQNAVVGNMDIEGDGGQNQTGLSHNTSGPGSLRWTDKGNLGVPTNPSGAAISWVNGTVFNGNTFNERQADFSNYDTVTFRMSATDALNAGGNLGVQAFFQTANYTFHTTAPGFGVGAAGEILLPIDGQFHELTFRLANLLPDNSPIPGVQPDLRTVQAFGINLFSHTNNLVMDVDFVRFNEVDLLEGDFNDNGVVDAADYVVWRKSAGSEANYNLWVQHFGEIAAGAGGSGAAIPEPASLALLSITVIGTARRRSRRA